MRCLFIFLYNSTLLAPRPPQGARRFHNWEPFSVFSYGDFGHQGATPTTADSSGYYGYFPDWNGSAGDWTQEQQQAYGGNVNGYSGAGWEGGWAEVAGAKEGGAELWAVDPQHDPHSAYNQGSYSYSTEYEGYDYPGNEHGYQDWQQQEQQQQGWVQPWSADAYENGYYANQAPYASTGEAYGGAASYDGAACAPSEWSPDTAHNSNSSAADGGNQEKWAALSAATPQDWSGSTAETTDYYDYDGAAAFEAATNQAIVNVGKAAGDAADWEGWGTPGTASGTDGYASTSTSAGGGAGDTRGTDGRMSGEATSSSGRPWSVNEYGQRVCGDWVEYWDESAQAAYFYNTATGEVRHIQCAVAAKANVNVTRLHKRSRITVSGLSATSSAHFAVRRATKKRPLRGVDVRQNMVHVSMAYWPARLCCYCSYRSFERHPVHGNLQQMQPLVAIRPCPPPCRSLPRTHQQASWTEPATG